MSSSSSSSLISRRSEVFTRYWESGYLTDLTLICRNGSMNAHKLLLASASSFWKCLLLKGRSYNGGGDEDTISILLPEMDLKDLELILTCIYTGNVDLTNYSGDFTDTLEQFLPDFKYHFNNNQVLLIKKSCWSSYNHLEEEEKKDCRNPITLEREPHEIMSLLDQPFDDIQKDKENLILETVPPPKKKSCKNPSEKLTNFTCNLCFKSFKYNKDLIKHSLIHTGELPFKCKLCDKAFRNVSNCYKHLRVVHDIKVKIGDYTETTLEEINRKRRIVDPNLDIQSCIDNAEIISEDARGNKLYECPICKKPFIKKYLGTHLNIHSGVKPHQCDKCDKSFFSYPGLSKHKNVEHVETNEKDREGLYKCEYCKKEFSQRSNLYVHQRQIHNLKVGRTELKHKCNYCSKFLDGKVELTKHKLKEHKGEAGELCSICGKRFLLEEQLLRHQSIHSERDRNFQCSFCTKTYFRKDLLKLHEKLHTDPLHCNICGKKFSLSKQLEAHIKCRHQLKNFQCEICDKMFSSENLLNQHFPIHLNDQVNEEPTEFSCDLCHQVFLTKSFLNSHKMTSHMDQYPLQCSTCNKGFMSESQLHKHNENIHLVKASELLDCQHCDVSNIRNLYGLKRHLVKHKCPLVLNLQECMTCINDLETYTRLQKHVTINARKRIHECKICQRRFRTKQEVLNHNVVHSKNKPYSCNLCSERFTQRASLDSHLIRHEKGLVSKSYPCGICDKVLTKYTALKSHRKSHHKKSVLSIPTTMIPQTMNSIATPDIVSSVNPPPIIDFAPGLVVDEMTTHIIQVIDPTVSLVG